MTSPTDRVIMVPGLCEPPLSMWPMYYALRRQGAAVTMWSDRWAFRNLELSVQRLREAIAGSGESSIAIVTHSFGDWVARAAIAAACEHRVGALVSIAPVMRGGFLPSLAYALSGNLVPEIAVIMDCDRAASNLDCDHRVRRLVGWAAADESVHSVDLSQIENIEVHRVMATHLTVVMQPRVIRLVQRFLFADCESAQSATAAP